ncbi:MAG: autotransporter domain-containing protein [Novosphingobium sp.]|nr:autotransporter domain-containing protein [Novosphingobium sp.]
MAICTCLATPAFAQAEEAEEATGDTPWSLSFGVGSSLVSDSKDPWSTSADLTRTIGDASLSLGFARSKDPGSPEVPTALGSTTNQFTLSGGYGFGSVGLSVYGSYGKRKFDGRTYQTRKGNPVTIDCSGKSYGLGATATLWLPLDEKTSISPYASIDYDSTETANAVVLPQRGLVSVKQKEKGTTGSFGASLDRSFGKDAAHSISLNAAFVTTSNSAAASSNIKLRSGIAQRLRPLAGGGGSDSWFEYGASLYFTVNDVIGLSVSASRTAGLPGPQSTSLYSGLSFSF